MISTRLSEQIHKLLLLHSFTITMLTISRSSVWRLRLNAAYANMKNPCDHSEFQTLSVDWNRRIRHGEHYSFQRRLARSKLFVRFTHLDVLYAHSNIFLLTWKSSERQGGEDLTCFATTPVLSSTSLSTASETSPHFIW